MVTPIEYYEGVGAHDNEHPWAYMTCEELLDKFVDDPTAKRFLKTMARSDLATESHNTNGLNALKNFVMDVDGYIGLYSIQNGNEQIIERLREEIDADIQFNHRVLKVGKGDSGRYQLNMMNGKGPETRDFDLVVMALPHNWLATMGWDNEQLRTSMVKHVAYFDRPAHYLRVALLFDEPFWGEKIPAPGSCRKRSAAAASKTRAPPRRRQARRAQLAIAGADAMAFANLSDQELIEAALKSLPASLGTPATFHGRQDHGWLSSVNARGRPAGARRHDNHRRSRRASGIVVVGTTVRFDAERSARLLRRRTRHHLRK